VEIDARGFEASQPAARALEQPKQQRLGLGVAMSRARGRRS
jgi:hypothetical protein